MSDIPLSVLALQKTTSIWHDRSSFAFPHDAGERHDTRSRYRTAQRGVLACLRVAHQATRASTIRMPSTTNASIPDLPGDLASRLARRPSRRLTPAKKLVALAKRTRYFRLIAMLD